MAFSLATVILDRGRVGAVETGGVFWSLDRLVAAGAKLGATSVKGLLENWTHSFAQLEQIATDCAGGIYGAELSIPRSAVRLDTPVRFPNKLIAVGANYASHLSEMGLKVAKWSPMPFFLMSPTTCLVGPGRTVRMPRDSNQLDWEIELAVIIGDRLVDASPARALSAIAGYSIGLDLTARDLVSPKDQPADFVRGKGQDTMAPCGPSMLPAQFVRDPHDLRLTLDVNGRRYQDGSTSEMIYRIDEQISIVSRFVTIEPGDIFFTGTPAGTGKKHGVFLKPGDRIRGEIGPIGMLEIEVGDLHLNDDMELL